MALLAAEEAIDSALVVVAGVVNASSAFPIHALKLLRM